ncbi:MAG TPA: hypothetical protein VL400_26080 [Polyangiaceae bacterium]|nr:hypothetical protein [Polyangiaceae bacterium]
MAAASGRLGADVVARYLVSLRHLVGNTVPTLVHAERAAKAAGDVALASHFALKRREEAGHDRWADHDIEVLAKQLGERFIGGPARAIRDLLADNLDAIDAEPRTYLAYMLWAEYFTVLAGGPFAKYVVERCGIPSEAMTCLARHAELDADHATEGMDVIDRLVTDPGLLRPLRASMRRAMNHFDRFCDELLEPCVTSHVYDLRVAV